MRRILSTMLFVLLIVGCSCEQPDALNFVISLPDDTDILSSSQRAEVQEMIDAFNARTKEYYMWTGATVTNDEATKFNNTLADAEIMGIFVDICADEKLYVNTTDEEAQSICDDLNALNTNAFSRIMFFIDSVAKSKTGKVITVYDENKDIFK